MAAKLVILLLRALVRNEQVPVRVRLHSYGGEKRVRHKMKEKLNAKLGATRAKRCENAARPTDRQAGKQAGGQRPPAPPTGALTSPAAARCSSAPRGCWSSVPLCGRDALFALTCGLRLYAAVAFYFSGGKCVVVNK